MLGELKRPALPHNIPKRKRLVLVRWSLSRQLSIDAANVLLTDIAAMDPSSLEEITQSPSVKNIACVQNKPE